MKEKTETIFVKLNEIKSVPRSSGVCVCMFLVHLIHSFPLDYAHCRRRGRDDVAMLPIFFGSFFCGWQLMLALTTKSETECTTNDG